MSYTFTRPNQSPWLIDIYNKYLPYKRDGFLVEIGVGHTLQTVDKELPEDVAFLPRVGSNTADLIDLGWSGIYIDPVEEYCREAMIAHRHSVQDCRLRILNLGASNSDGELELFLGDSFVPNSLGTRGYNWVGRKVKTRKTSDILAQFNTRFNIDLMSIDVEGFEDKVIQGIDFQKHCPRLMIIEINRVKMEIISDLLPPQYTLVGKDRLNAVWVII